jgi:hypothetical protein
MSLAVQLRQLRAPSFRLGPQTPAEGQPYLGAIAVVSGVLAGLQNERAQASQHHERKRDNDPGQRAVDAGAVIKIRGNAKEPGEGADRTNYHTQTEKQMPTSPPGRRRAAAGPPPGRRRAAAGPPPASRLLIILIAARQGKKGSSSEKREPITALERRLGSCDL